MSDYYIYNGELYSADELEHYGVPGMRWGKRKVIRYENKAQRYRNSAADLNPKNYTVKLSDRERTRLTSQMNKDLRRAAKYDYKAAKKETKIANKAEKKAAKKLQKAMGTRREDKVAKKYNDVRQAQEVANKNRAKTQKAYDKLRTEKVKDLANNGADKLKKGKKRIDRLRNS